MSDTFHSLLYSYKSRALYWLIFACGIVLCLWIWARSTGSSADDELAHMIISRNVWRTPYLVLDLWGRPVNTLLYMPGALFGLFGVRLTALIMTGFDVLLTTHIARKLGLSRLYLIPLLILFQPGVIDQSYAAVTGVPFMLLLTLGIALWLDDHLVWASIVFACLSLTRHEGIALFGVWFGYMLMRRQWRAAFWGWLPIALYNLAFLIVVMPPLSELPFLTYFTPNRSKEYGAGSWVHFIGGLLIMAGLPVLLWTIYAMPRLKRLGDRLLIFLPHILYFAIHTVLFRFGLFATAGYYEFLLPILPAVGMIAALGAEGVIEGVLRRVYWRPTGRLLGGIWMMLVFIPVIALGLTTEPRKIVLGQQTTIDAARWMLTTDIPHERIHSMSVWFYAFYDLPLRQFDGWIHLPTPDEMQAGDTLIWENYLEAYTGYTLEYLSDPGNGWIEIADFEGAKVFVRR